MERHFALRIFIPSSFASTQHGSNQKQVPRVQFYLWAQLHNGEYKNGWAIRMDVPKIEMQTVRWISFQFEVSSQRDANDFIKVVIPVLGGTTLLAHFRRKFKQLRLEMMSPRLFFMSQHSGFRGIVYPHFFLNNRLDAPAFFRPISVFFMSCLSPLCWFS